MKHKNLLLHIKMSKEVIKFLVILKLKDRNFTTMKIHIFLKKDNDIDKTLISDWISSSEKNYIYFIGHKKI